MVEEVGPATPPQPDESRRAGRLTRSCKRYAQALQPYLLTLALCSAALGLYTWTGDGGEGYRSAPALLRQASWALWCALAALALALLPRPSAAKEHAARLWPLLEKVSPALAVATATVTLWFVVSHGSFIAGGPDASGYLNQASMWARGEIVVPADPLMRVAPWPDAQWTFMPLGYCLRASPGTLAPSYPAGLPLLMATAQHIAGPNAAFSIVPLTVLLLLGSSYALGRQIAGPVAGAMATAIVASSPIVLFLGRSIMSDLPAAAFWVAASAALLRPRATSPLLAGLLASLAILVRPNLAPLALPLAIFALWHAAGRRDALRAASLLSLGLLPGIVLTAAIHATLYGSPLRSGYGPLTYVYGWRHLLASLAAYPARALMSHTALLFAAFAAPFLPRSSESRGGARPASVLLLAMAATTFLCYAFYSPFKEWWYLRFLISSVVWMLVLVCAVLVGLILYLPRPARAAAAVLVTSVVVGLLLQRAAALNVLNAQIHERRYLATARWINEHLPKNAAILCMLHSGSLRYYTRHPILRFDQLPRKKLDRALSFLREKGYTPYIVVDCVAEPTAFGIRFYGRSEFAQLDWPARARIAQDGCVRVYDPADRERYRSGEELITEQVP
jgi:hypothetical protein